MRFMPIILKLTSENPLHSVLPGINYEADLSLSCVDCNIDTLPGTTNPRDCILDL